MRLQKAAAGLLSLMELKVDGGNPPEFGNTVTPIIDVAEFYTVPNQLVVTATGNVTANGDAVTYTVPAGYMLRVRQVGFQVTAGGAIAAADGIGGALYFAPNPGGSGIQLAAGVSSPKITLAAAWSISVAQSLVRPVLALPGSQFAFVSDRTAAGACSATFRMLVDQLVYP